MIPRILHRIWLGDCAMPAEYEAYWQRFIRMNPGWSFCTWRDGAAGEIPWLLNDREFDLATSYAQKADIARYEILMSLGGVYVDCDVEPLRPLEPLLEAGAFIGLEDGEYVCNAVIGAEPQHPFIRALVARLPEAFGRWIEGPINRQTGPMFVLDVLRSQEWDGLVVHPSSAFYPYHWSEGDPGIYPDASYTVHHWAKSWTS